MRTSIAEDWLGNVTVCMLITIVPDSPSNTSVLLIVTAGALGKTVSVCSLLVIAVPEVTGDMLWVFGDVLLAFEDLLQVLMDVLVAFKTVRVVEALDTVLWVGVKVVK